MANMSLTTSVVAYKEAWILGRRRADTTEQVCRRVMELQRHWNAQPRSFRYASLGLAGETWELKAQDLVILMDACKDVNSTRPSGFTEAIHLS